MKYPKKIEIEHQKLVRVLCPAARGDGGVVRAVSDSE